MGFRVTHKGNFNNLEKLLKKASKAVNLSSFVKYAERGLQVLRDNTPIDSGLLASSWGYDLEVSGEGVRISWTNSDINKHIPIAIIVDTGHYTGTGGYVSGRNYIDSSIQPVMDEIIEQMWKELTR